MRALYGMVVTALLWYKHFRTDFENEGFVFNPYNPYVVNKTVNNKQQAVQFHIDDLMSSHAEARQVFQMDQQDVWQLW